MLALDFVTSSLVLYCSGLLMTFVQDCAWPIPHLSRFNCSIHPFFSFRGLFNQEQWNNTWSYRRHTVHCLPPCSLRCPVEVHGVTSTTKAQKGEGSCETEEFCVKMVGNILQLLTV
ncbi:uncharacterized protein sb:cb288 isoform X1 [Cheilinus undulatus]|uniref:uncharacterized protein sb:cb288 isoform X1 n=1 Tax=Cheilinus undulatus TaxID=241271 RepID=UPI001BD5B01E|nr:uncharacterized protein sb:cb288 isoform X1 [Cheilinus undulatus]